MNHTAAKKESTSLIGTIIVEGLASACCTCPITVRRRAMQMKGVHGAVVDYEVTTAISDSNHYL